MMAALLLRGKRGSAPERRTQQPARVARIELQARSQRSHVGALAPDLPQDPRLGERPITRQEAVVQRPDALRHRPIEVANPVHPQLGSIL